SSRNGKTILITEEKTSGEAAQIVLKADRSLINADGNDLSFITVMVADKNGIMVPTADNLIHFIISGEGFIAGVDSGDPVSHESFKGDKHTAMNGLALAILQSNGKKGKITLTAYSDGLISSTITVVAK
ncbi:MAG: glycoside hydrolase family 2, partial [Bacteroidota bacterium]|nr:glycoside hydrolase family 2 [Bacteroidota bacterium]